MDAASDRRLLSPEIPTLNCACGLPASLHTSFTARNPRRRWLECGNQGRCFLWIWEDLLNGYTEEVVAYCHAGKYDNLQETIDVLENMLTKKTKENSRLSDIIEEKENELKQARVESAELNKV
ncbi:uncharacterized protein LOC102713755 [Oryza brachyantha]|uniref:uncharacterized protein LOC102713755 n=1 Tax=Oryza brachyantha TaxID=4533 RepID=UPI0003EA9D0D|nr:uncharacterized protein LOC102713755 [Oryza brachyantha]